MLKQDERLFYFIFPMILFSSDGKWEKGIKSLIDEHSEHFMKMLTRYLFFTSNDNHEFVAITSGTIVELIHHLKQINES